MGGWLGRIGRLLVLPSWTVVVGAGCTKCNHIDWMQSYRLDAGFYEEEEEEEEQEHEDGDRTVA